MAKWMIEAKTEYATNSDLTLKDIAGKYGKTEGYVRQVAAKQGWDAERTEHEQNTSKRAREKIEEKDAKRLYTIFQGHLLSASRCIEGMQVENLKPKDYKECAIGLEKAVRGIVALAPMIGIPLVEERKIEEKTSEGMREWYMRVVKEFAPEFLNGK